MVRNLALVLFCFMSVFGGLAMAASGALDRIVVSTEGENSVIKLQFTIPVRYISHTLNKTGTEVAVQLQIMQAAAQEKADLVSRDRLSWKSSQTVPLSSVEFQGTGLSTANLVLLFDTPVVGFRVRESRDFHSLEFLINQPTELSGGVSRQPTVSLLDLHKSVHLTCCYCQTAIITRPRIELSGERISPLFEKVAV